MIQAPGQTFTPLAFVQETAMLISQSASTLKVDNITRKIFEASFIICGRTLRFRLD
jgi:hypothetical protein